MADAPAPAPAPEAAAPATPVEGEKPAASAPADPMQEFDALLKKTPLKFKAGGKERGVGSVKELLRYAEQAVGLQTKAQELAAREEKARLVEERDARLSRARNGRERAAILREYHGEAFDEAAEEAILERIELERSMQTLTPAERQLRQEAEEARAELARMKAEQQRREEEAQQASERQEYEATRAHLADIATKALQALKLPKEAAPDAMRRLAVAIHRATALGLELDPQTLAAEVVKDTAPTFRNYTSGLEGDALLDFLGPEVSLRVSRALVARHEGKRAVQASVPAPQAEAPKPQQRNGYQSPTAGWRDLEKGIF